MQAVPRQSLEPSPSPSLSMDASRKDAPRVGTTIIGKTGVSATGGTGYHPLLHTPGSRDHPWAQVLHGHFGLQALKTFYPIFRLGGYTFELLGKPSTSQYATEFQHVRENDRSRFHKYMPGFMAEMGAKQRRDFISKSIDRSEAVVFGALAFTNFHRDRKDLFETCDLAVKAELGLPEKQKLTFHDLFKSKNPLVVTALDRFCWQHGFRFAASAGFLATLRTGIGLNLIVITLERSIFNRNVALDILSNAVNEVQINNLDTEATKQGLVISLIKVLQQERLDHRQDRIPVEQIDALKPTLERIADDVISKRFGRLAMTYIMGGGVIIPENPAQTVANYDRLHEIGVAGIIRERSANDNAVPQTRIGERQIAESARHESLIEQRARIANRSPAHLGTPEMRRGSERGLGF